MFLKNYDGDVEDLCLTFSVSTGDAPCVSCVCVCGPTCVAFCIRRVWFHTRNRFGAWRLQHPRDETEPIEVHLPGRRVAFGHLNQASVRRISPWAQFINPQGAVDGVHGTGVTGCWGTL
jgi:hypothetical protein